MHSLVTASTKSYQIGLDIIAQLAPRPNVLDLEIFHAPARLATLIISLQDLAAELAIGFRSKPQGAFRYFFLVCAHLVVLPIIRELTCVE